jgi:hypothetical protein
MCKLLLKSVDLLLLCGSSIQGLGTSDLGTSKLLVEFVDLLLLGRSGGESTVKLTLE